MLLTNVVLRFAPLAWTNEVLVKFVPVAVSVTGPLPATVEDGEIAVSVGLTVVPGVIVKFRAFEVQPPPSAFATVNASCPAVLRSLALSCTLICVPLMNVVGRVLPLNRTCESEKKFVPVKVIVWAELPACKLVGEILRKIGMVEELCTKGFRMASSCAAVACLARYECPTFGVCVQLFDPAGDCEKLLTIV